MFRFNVQWKIILVRFNFVKLVLFLFYSCQSLFTFLMLHSLSLFLFNPFCLLDGKGRVLTIFLTFSISCWNKISLWIKWVFLVDIRLVYESNLKNLGKKVFLMIKNCIKHFILLFDIFVRLYYFCIVYVENKYLIDALYFP